MRKGCVFGGSCVFVFFVIVVVVVIFKRRKLKFREG